MRKNWLDMPKEYLQPLITMMKNNGELNFLCVVGRSMEPTIQKGAMIKVDTNYDQIDIDDIIVFLNNSHLTTHRVIRVEYGNNKKAYITKGDRIEGVTEYVLEDEVVGKVISFKNPVPEQESMENFMGCLETED